MWNQVKQPTLLLDEQKCRANIKKMFEKAQKHNLQFRPHFKTHQSLEIGRWFKEAGVEKITVSSLQMARYFAPEWKDITVAFPVNILEIDSIHQLSKDIQLNLLIESAETLLFLKQNLQNSIGFFIKIDVGTKRTGIDPDNIVLIDEILKLSQTSEKLHFKGFLAHTGHTYSCHNKACIIEAHQKAQKLLQELKANYQKEYPNLMISYGDTPSCSLVDDFSGIDEIRPGNFAFYDWMQHKISSCKIEEIAVAMACPVVALHPERNEVVLYGGAVHFSKDFILDESGTKTFGQVIQKTENGWTSNPQKAYLKKLSQEHGILSVPDKEISQYKVGDVICILPIHSCLTANLIKSYQTLDGKEIQMM